MSFFKTKSSCTFFTYVILKPFPSSPSLCLSIRRYRAGHPSYQPAHFALHRVSTSSILGARVAPPSFQLETEVSCRVTYISYDLLGISDSLYFSLSGLHKRFRKMTTMVHSDISVVPSPLCSMVPCPPGLAIDISCYPIRYPVGCGFPGPTS